MRVSLQDVQKNLSAIANRPQYDFDIVYDILLAYGKPQATISKLKSGSINRALDGNGVALKNYLYWQVFPKGTNLVMQIDDLKSKNEESKCNARYIVATDLDDLVAIDLGNNGASGEGTLSIKLRDIDRDAAFFYGLTGNKIVDAGSESVADRQAAEKMNELYAEIERVNLDRLQDDPGFLHGLNVFFTRLLFCFFSEDTGIFEDKQFTNAVKDYTNPDGSDLDWFLSEIFQALDTNDDDKPSLSMPFNSFPYVNGTVFDTSRHDIVIPKFSAQARYLLLQCGARDWSNINPDIFGTMFQGIVDPLKRSENGMDYTSVPNIMRVIQPLFLDDLNDEFEKCQDNESKLWNLLERISKIKVFDPACGSGNFLIISFKQLRLLQYQILEQIDSIRPSGLPRNSLKESQLISINNFYGIEIDDFAHELAVLSLHIAHQQMNMEFSKQFGIAFPIIPLIDAPHIVCANAARIDWQAVCLNRSRIANKPTISGTISLLGDQMPDNSMSVEQAAEYDEIYLIGNPPYLGSRNQTAAMKSDMEAVLDDVDGYRYLDYIAIWFKKASEYIGKTKAEACFLSTNSICQGDQVRILWPHILRNGIGIRFCYTSFKWKNNASDVAGVMCVIICLAYNSDKKKMIIDSGVASEAKRINAYLADAADEVFVEKAMAPINGLPKMCKGVPAGDGNNLVMSREQMANLCAGCSLVKQYIKRYIGSNEFINGLDRFCLAIGPSDYNELKSIPKLSEIFERVSKFRLSSKDKSIRVLAGKPYQLQRPATWSSCTVVIPVVSSERRLYIPIGFVGDNTVVSYAAFAIYNAQPWLLSLLESRMHMVWIRTVCGKLKTDFRYSNTLGYNTFPVPELTDDAKNELNQSARNILFARENHSEKTLAELYDPDNMPDDLREAHVRNDLLVDSLYKATKFRNDEERLSRLFELYEQMTK